MRKLTKRRQPLIDRRSLSEEQIVIIDCIELVSRFGGVENAIEHCKTYIEACHAKLKELDVASVEWDAYYAMAESQIQRLNTIKQSFYE